MKKTKTILYIGNNLSEKTKYKISMDILSENLKNKDFIVLKYSNIKNKILRLLHMIFGIITKFKKSDYVLIDTYSTVNFYYAFVISQICRILKLKYIPILHGGNLPNRLLKNPTLSNLIFKNSYINIAPSKYLEVAFKKHKYEVELIPNTINILDYPYQHRKKLQPNLFFVRAFAKIYNPCMAIEVLKELQKEYPTAKLCMVGPDRDGTLKEVSSIIKKYNLEESVEITGVLTKKEWHKKSRNFDIFINTTNVDNTPISIIEAMALGLPVVSTKVGGIPYLIDDKETGLLVGTNDVKTMVFEIKKLLQGSYNQLARNARVQVEGYDWNIVRTKWIKILE